MILLVGQSKGGVGKSMIAINLAVMAAQRGRSVLLVDTDDQGTCGMWSTNRMVQGVTPDVRVVSLRITPEYSPKKFSESLVGFAQSYDEVIVDSGGKDSRELRTSLAIADTLLAPVRATQADVWGAANLDEIVAEVSVNNPDLRSLVVLNFMTALNPHSFIEMAIEAVGEMESLTYSKCAIMDRPCYNFALLQGMGILDLEIDSKSRVSAVKELNRLYESVYGSSEPAEQVA